MCFYEIFWSIGVILLPGIAYIDPNWSSISLMITLPTILYIAVWWFIPDTPRWFLAKGQVDEAMDIIKYAVSVNNTKHVMSEAEIRKRLIDHVASSEKQPAPAKWSSLWNDRRTVVSILAIHISWAIYVTNYNGMLLNVKAFGREYLSLNTIALGEYVLGFRALHFPRTFYLSLSCRVTLSILSVYILTTNVPVHSI